MIAVHLYLLVVTPMDWDKKKSLKVVYHIIGWLIPGKIAVIYPFTVTAVLSFAGNKSTVYNFNSYVFFER